MFVYLYIHNIIGSTHTYYTLNRQKCKLFWMRLIVINHLTALLKSSPREAQYYADDEKRSEELNLFSESHHRTGLNDSFVNQTDR